MTSLFVIVVLMLKEVRPIPPRTLPMTRFPVTVASRAWRTSIENPGKSPCPTSWKPRIVKPETLTSFTRGPVISPVWKFMSPKNVRAALPWGDRFVGDVLHGRRQRSFGLERHSPREHLVEDHAKGVEVARGAYPPSHCLLGGHVAGRAEH